MNRCLRTITLLLLASCAALLLPGTVARAQEDESLFGSTMSLFGNVLEPLPKTSHDRIHPGAPFQLALVLEISYPWHINSSRPNQDFLIPTTLVFEPPEGIELGPIVFPESEEIDFEFMDGPMAVYDGTVILGVEGEAARTLEPGRYEIPATLTYQACDDKQCLVPTDVEVVFELIVAGLDEPSSMIDLEIFAAVDWGGDDTGGEEVGSVGTMVAEKGIFVSLLFLYLGGLALNLTPCVYPLIPITISYFGGQAGGRPAKTFGLAAIYVLGMAITYSVLGVVAAMSGGLLGSALQNPLVLVFVAAVIVALALSMFGFYEIRVPQSLSNFAGGSKQGVLGSLFMGLTMGIVAAPCIGPFVLSLLIFVSEKGEPLLGFLFFFVLAVGLGTPFLFIGTLSGALPKPGAWMEWIRKIFGVVLLGMAVYFLSGPLSTEAYRWLLAAVAILGGVYLGVLEGTRMAGRGFLLVRRTVGIVFVAAGIWMLTPSAFLFEEPEESPVDWRPYDDELLLQAVTDDLPVIIDFTAEWCIPCKELDELTFDDPEFVELSKQLLPIRADMTHSGDPEVQALREKFRVIGVPTVVFLDRDGNEIEELRFTGFIPAEPFVEKVRSLMRESRAGL